MNFTKEEALDYMGSRINTEEIFFVIIDGNMIILQDGETLELEDEFIYKGNKFLAESDLEKEFSRIFNKRYVDLTYCIENGEDY